MRSGKQPVQKNPKALFMQVLLGKPLLIAKASNRDLSTVVSNVRL